MGLAEPQPIDARFVEMVSQYLDGIEARITTNSEPRHMRFLRPRRPFVSNTQAQVIGTASFACDNDFPELPAWVKASVILWSRELVEAEMLRQPFPHGKEANPRPVASSRERDRDLPHQGVVI